MDKTAELLKKVRRIELKTRGLSSDLFAGEYHTAFKGKGMSFSEVRAYQFGDDVRNIDWNVTARTGEPFVKVFEEEREMTVMLMVDVSGSTAFGTEKGWHGDAALKQDIIAEICAVIAFSATTNNDKVGVILFSDKVEKFIAPKKGRNHILRIIREVLNFSPTGNGTDLNEALRFTRNMLKKRAIVFMLSDFRQPSEAQSYQEALSIVRRRHDLVGIHLFDPKEAEMPDAGLLKLKDGETKKTRWVFTGSKQVRLKHAASFLAHQQKTTETFRRAGADLVNLSTQQDYIKPLVNMFRQREKRRA